MSTTKKPRTFVVKQPMMSGADVKEWQQSVKAQFKKMNIDCPIAVDGKYGRGTRSFTAALVKSKGLSPHKALEHGLTPELRHKLRHDDLTAAQNKVRHSKARQGYRHSLKAQWTPNKVHRITPVITTDDWGYHPGVHDGVDVCTPPDAVLFAMVKAKVIDVRSSGWWNLGAPSDPAIKAKGDGIIQIRVLETVGPFKKGMDLAYGHAEKARVKVGQIVEAGTVIGHAGMANAWHTHFMVNHDPDLRGVGTQDPRPLIDYAIKHSN